MSLHDHEPLITVRSVHDDGVLALYTSGWDGRIHLDLGDDIVTTSDTDLAPLAKAILNAVEPEALVENQKDAEPERDLAAEIDTLNAKVAALEAAADPEIRVGDTVRVEPDDWNIPTPSSTRGLAVTGTVISIADPRGRKCYLVEYRSLVTGNLISIYALKATKVVSRG